MKYIILVLGFLVYSPNLLSQDLLDTLEKEAPQTTDYVTSTFKGTRILNGHSIENRKKGTLEFIISHRFGKINSGIDELFGLDHSNVRFAFEYGLTNDIMLGMGRSSFEKTYDAFIKYKILKQSSGKNSFPLSVSLFESTAYKTIKDYDPINEPNFNEQLIYTSQILIARKFNANLSFQISPTFIHRNSVRIDNDPHDIFAIGFGNRIKLSNRVSLNGEYYYTINPLKSINAKNSFALGIDIETGGHVFQLILSNSITMIEKGFITETTGNFFKGDIHFGFNISRAFQTGSRKAKELEKMIEEEK